MTPTPIGGSGKTYRLADNESNHPSKSDIPALDKGDFAVADDGIYFEDGS